MPRSCRAMRCPRLREYCRRIGREKRRAFRDETYWARPVPGFGDPQARLLIVGLAPAAHGANRTGRVFTGDGVGGSGDFLMSALHRAGFANLPTSHHAGDGLKLARRVYRRRGPVRAARQQADAGGNRHLPGPPRRRARRASRASACRRARADRFRRVSSAVQAARHRRCARGRGSGTARSHRLPNGHTLIGCYHPSRQNTNTGKLTARMMDDVFGRQAGRSAPLATENLKAEVCGLRRFVQTSHLRFQVSSPPAGSAAPSRQVCR